MQSDILAATRQLVFIYGAKRVTMDEIAASLAISKKTLYQHYPDKVQLLSDLIYNELKEHQTIILNLRTQSKSAIDEMVQTMHHLHQMFMQINPVFFYDLRRYYKQVWKIFTDFKNNFVNDIVRDNLKRGIAEAFYRPEINIEIITRLRLAEIELPSTDAFYNDYKADFVKLNFEIMKHFLFGIATLKGHKLISKLI
jgi:AcrR family transcriptional regulator